MLALQPSSFQPPASRPTIAVLRPSLCLRSPKLTYPCRCHCHPSESTDDGNLRVGRTTLGSLTVTAVFLALGFRFASGALVRPPPAAAAFASDLRGSNSALPAETRSGDSGDTSFQGNDNKVEDGGGEEERENVSLEDRKLEEAFEQWKSKSYALTVPLTVVSLRGSVPPSWIKDFLASQGKRVRLQFKLNDSLEDIVSNLSIAFSKGNVKSTSPAAADVVSIGDSWLPYAIKNGLVEPIDGEEEEWFCQLSDKWKTYLRRNSGGVAAADGEIWAAPYRWGCMVIAYKKSKFEKLGLDPIEDWKDLWRPELGGRISMIDCPREVIGIVLKYMGYSYNTISLDNNVSGGTSAIQKNLALLAKQVRLFDSKYYLKALGVDDVWVAVGWSSDIIPAAKRLRNIAVIVPKSGASLWADLWAIPSTSKLKDSHQVGGRVRGASPLCRQWMEFCMQPVRALPFHQGVIPGAIPSALNGPLPKENAVLTKGQPKLETNLISGVPPPEIMSRCEFLEPLSGATTAEYDRLIRTLERPGSGFIEQWHDRLSQLLQTVGMKLHAKGT
ncbi:hypothetical protein MLD38_026655 [Melastoma candidum]|uniref:Uncharacterized protein n=1 Tax=Melastoma candidum TaxID=119954 RepID=A0ACB9P0U4_9MYRT|nr:hypothetical protein MLD38_026655 [Melastoma candidum]